MDYTSSYASEASVGSNTAVEIVAPGTNANGYEIVNMQIDSVGPHCAFIAKTSSPSGTADGAVLLYAKANTGLQKGPTDKIVIPAGQGIYFIGNSSGSPFRSALLKAL